MAEAKPSLNEVLESLDLKEDDADQLREALGATSDEELRDRMVALRQYAFRELVEWLMSTRRFTTLAEMDSARVLAIFAEIRREYPTVEQLVDGLAISSSKATSLLGRLRYGEGRTLLRLARSAAAAEIHGKLEAAESDPDGRKTVFLGKPSFNEVQEVSFLILSEPSEHGKGGRYEAAEVPMLSSSGRLGGSVTTSERMWQHIAELIEERSK